MAFEHLTNSSLDPQLSDDIDVLSGAAEARLFERQLKAQRRMDEAKEQPYQRRRARADVEASLRPGILPTISALTAHERRNYSLVKFLDNLTRHPNSKLEPSLEVEISSSISADLKSTNMPGFFVPLSLRPHASGLDTKTDSAGRYLLGSPVREIVDYLENISRVISLGAQVLSGIGAAPSFPVEDQPSVATWLAENRESDVSESDPAFGFRGPKPKTLQGTTSFSRELLQQSSPRIEAWLRRKLAGSHALALDLAAIAGTGDNNQPTGILSTDNVGEQVAGDPDGAAVDAADLIELERQVGAANADSALGFLTNSLQRSKLRAVPRLTGGVESPLWTDDNTVLGYRAEASNQVPNTLSKGSSNDCSAIIFGSWSSLLLLEFVGAMGVLTDPFCKKKQGLVELSSFGMYDLVLQQPSAFSVIRDAR